MPAPKRRRRLRPPFLFEPGSLVASRYATDIANRPLIYFLCDCTPAVLYRYEANLLTASEVQLRTDGDRFALDLLDPFRAVARLVEGGGAPAQDVAGAFRHGAREIGLCLLRFGDPLGALRPTTLPLSRWFVSEDWMFG